MSLKKQKKAAYNDCLRLGMRVDIIAADNIQIQFKKSNGQNTIDIEEEEQYEDIETLHTVSLKRF